MIIDQFNQTIDFWIEELNRFEYHDLIIKPDSKTWSIGQLYEHLIEDSQWYLEQAEKTLGNQEHAYKPTSEQAKVLFGRGSFENIRIVGDPNSSENVKQPISHYQLKADMEKLKENTNELWVRLQSTLISGKSEHPGFGFLDGYEWIRFSEMHLRHHLRQKERLEKMLIKRR